MPRKVVPANSLCPYHVTARSVNRESFPIDIESMWSLYGDYLYLISGTYALRIHSFVMMPNHFHLIVSAPLANLSEAMRYFLRETSREISRLSGRINQSYGTRHHKSLISSHHYFMNAYKYVYRNPVRAGLCDRVEDYKFSTLSGLMGFAPLLIPVIEDTLLFPEDFDEGILRWLNTNPLANSEDEVRRALKRPSFSLTRNGRFESSLETRLL